MLPLTRHAAPGCCLSSAGSERLADCPGGVLLLSLHLGRASVSRLWLLVSEESEPSELARRTPRALRLGANTRAGTRRRSGLLCVGQSSGESRRRPAREDASSAGTGRRAHSSRVPGRGSEEHGGAAAFSSPTHARPLAAASRLPGSHGSLGLVCLPVVCPPLAGLSVCGPEPLGAFASACTSRLASHLPGCRLGLREAASVCLLHTPHLSGPVGTGGARARAAQRPRLQTLTPAPASRWPAAAASPPSAADPPFPACLARWLGLRRRQSSWGRILPPPRGSGSGLGRRQRPWSSLVPSGFTPATVGGPGLRPGGPRRPLHRRSPTLRLPSVGRACLAGPPTAAPPQPGPALSCPSCAGPSAESRLLHAVLSPPVPRAPLRPASPGAPPAARPARPRERTGSRRRPVPSGPFSTSVLTTVFWALPVFSSFPAGGRRPRRALCRTRSPSV